MFQGGIGRGCGSGDKKGGWGIVGRRWACSGNVLSTIAFDDIGCGFALDTWKSCEYHYSSASQIGARLPWMARERLAANYIINRYIWPARWKNDPRESVLGPRGKFCPFAPPSPPRVKSSHLWTNSDTLASLARQDFLTFFGPRPKIFEKHCVIDLSEKTIDSIDDRLQPIKYFVLASQTNRNVAILLSKLKQTWLVVK